MVDILCIVPPPQWYDQTGANFATFASKVLLHEELRHDELLHIKRRLQLAVFDSGLTWRTTFDSWNSTKSGLLTLAQLKHGILKIPIFQSTRPSDKSLRALLLAADRDLENCM